ncbi:MAG: ribosome biogenesis GTPase RsgA [Gammaproteobacteria bacterium]|nr:ribosome biogenesis GTPase RsgA [Gammaproteobacteria bacterium]
MGLSLICVDVSAREPGRGYHSLDSAVSRARERTGGGRVLSAQTRELEGRRTHQIRILSKEGRVQRFRMDARSGRMAPPRRRR